MSLPEAIAESGVSTASPQPKRVALVVGVVAAAFAFVYYLGAPLPGRFVALFGMPRAGVARFGGLRMTWRPPSGLDADALARRFEDAEGRARLDRDGNAFVVDVSGVKEADVDAVAQQLGQGALEFHEVLETSEMRALSTVLEPELQAGRIELEVDSWTSRGNNEQHGDTFLRASSPAELDQAFARAASRGWRLPPGAHIAYQPVEPVAGAKDPRVFWRSYVLSDAVEVAGDAVVSAVTSHDTYTGRPVVQIALDPQGSEQFGALTARLVGHRLAIVVGDDVRSVPVVNTAIRGGRVEISMGAESPDRAEREAADLASALRAGPLPRGGVIVDARYVAGRDTSVLGWLARIAFAALFGGAVGLFASLCVRVARPTELRLPPFGNASTMRRVVWTLVGCALYMLGTSLVLPGVNRVELVHVLTRGSSYVDVTQVSVLALGIIPVITAFLLIEVVALAVPRWRKLRETPEGRRRLGLAVAIAAFVAAATQAYFVATYLQMMSRGGVDVVAGGAVTRWTIVATLTGGVALLVWVAALISHRGIGNGYAVLIAAGWLVSLVRRHLLATADARELVLAAVAFLGVVIVVAAMLRWRIRGLGRAPLPLPLSGYAPLFEAAGLSTVVALVSTFRLDRPVDALLDAELALERFPLIVVVVFAALWAWINARPRLRRAQLERAGTSAPDRAMWVRAVVLGTVMLVAVYALTQLTLRAAPRLHSVIDATMLMFVIATLLDVSDELRARSRGELVPVWPLPSPLLADAVRDKLAAVGIEHHLRSANARALLWFFGPHIPVVVLVPPADAERADKLVREIVVG